MSGQKNQSITDGSIKTFANLLLELPDGRYILQRRTKDAPYGAGRLGIFGGWIEAGETPEQCIRREIAEETSLEPAKLHIVSLANFIMPASEDFPEDRHFYIYRATIDSPDFDLYEGDGAEAYSIDEIKKRDDLTGSARYAFTTVIASS